MKTKSKIVVSLLTAAVTGQMGPGLQAGGFRLPDQDARATARGEAFVATADNPSAIYYNPAGMTQLQGNNVRGGVYGLYLDSSYHSPSGGEFDNQKDLHAVPQFFYTYGPEELPLAFGVGVYSPYGLSSKWPQDTGFRTVATEGSLTYLTANPAVAWRILPTLSIGAGLTINYSDIDLRQGLTPIPDNDEFRFRGDAWDVGFNLGLLWQISPKVYFGAAYHSETTMDFDGHTDTRVNAAVPPVFPFPFALRQEARANFPFPQNAVFGLSYRPTPAWNFEVNVDWTDWSRLNSVQIQQGTPVPPLELDWRSSCYYEFGATRTFGNGWSVSAGYIYNENAVPDAHYQPLVFDMNRHFLSAGVGFQGKHFSFDAAYQLGFAPTRTVSGSAPSPAGQTADGRYDNTSHALLLSLGWHF